MRRAFTLFLILFGISCGLSSLISFKKVYYQYRGGYQSLYEINGDHYVDQLDEKLADAKIKIEIDRPQDFLMAIFNLNESILKYEVCASFRTNYINPLVNERPSINPKYVLLLAQLILYVPDSIFESATSYSVQSIPYIYFSPQDKNKDGAYEGLTKTFKVNCRKLDPTIKNQEVEVGFWNDEIPYKKLKIFSVLEKSDKFKVSPLWYARGYADSYIEVKATFTSTFLLSLLIFGVLLSFTNTVWDLYLKINKK